MKKMFFKVLFLTSVIFTPLLTQNIFACSCSDNSTPYKELMNAKTVFIGKVIDVRDSSGNKVADEKVTDYNEFLRKNQASTKYYRFEIQELFKGEKTSKVIIASNINMCQFGFDVGEDYLVYAYKANDVLLTNLFCSRTAETKMAQDDIHFLHELLKNKSEPRIYGSVRFSEKDLAAGNFSYTFLAGIKIVAKSRSKRFETITDKDGLYRFYKIPNGTYEIYPVLPNKYVNDYPDLKEITLQTQDNYLSDEYFKFRGKSAYLRFNVGLNNKY